MSGILTGLFEKRLQPSRTGLAALGALGMASAAGPVVTEESSLRSTAVFAAVRILAESIAMLPLELYLKQGRERHPATDHPLYEILKYQPNEEQTSFEWRETSMAHLLLWGNAYSEIVWDDNGQVQALWPLRPDRMYLERKWDTGALWYYYQLPDSLRDQGGTIRFPAWKVHHIRGLSSDGVLGYSPIKLAGQNAVGLALATEEFGSRYFSNGAQPRIILRHPGKLTGEAQDRLLRSWRDGSSGLTNAHRTRIIEEGMDVTTVGVPPEEAQFIETRKYQVHEIARIFRVPAHMLAEYDNANYNSLAQLGGEFVRYSLMPWFARHVQAIRRDLLIGEEKRRYETTYNADALLTEDPATRAELHSSAIQNGWMSRNEVRISEGLNPVPGGDRMLIPLNMVEAGTAPAERAVEGADTCACGHEHRHEPGKTPSKPETRSEKLRDNRQALIRRNIGLFEDAAGRLVRREVADIRRALKKHVKRRSLSDFEAWLRQFYEDLRGVMPDYFQALMRSLAEQIAADVAGELGIEDPGLTDALREFIDGYLENYAWNYTNASERQILALIDEAGREEAEAEALISERLDGWEETRAGKEALGQAFEAGNALTLAVFAGAGVAMYAWAANGDSCPFCQNLDGKRVRVGEFFVNAGGTVDGGEDDEPMLVRRSLSHGPVHRGCDCVIVAV